MRIKIKARLITLSNQISLIFDLTFPIKNDQIINYFIFKVYKLLINICLFISNAIND